MMTPLHKQRVVPMSFFDDAINNSAEFLPEDAVGKPFGLNKEAYIPECYKDLHAETQKDVQKWVDTQEEDGVLCARLVEVRGSSGIGKSVFLAYMLAVHMKANELGNFAVFHSNKASKPGPGQNDLNEVLCTIYIGGQMIMDKQRYGLQQTRDALEKHLPTLDALFMDGCAMTFSLEEFYEIVIVAASPSMYTKNLRDALTFYRILCMPTWSRAESIELGNLLHISGEIVTKNYDYMNGIVRYMFEEGLAKQKVDTSVEAVSAKSLRDMVTTQQTDKETEKAMVHALIRWEPKRNADQSFNYGGKVRFELVSRYAEASVLQKLYKEEMNDLKETTKKLRSLLGGEGYAGSLFEAYAARRFLAGGKFKLKGPR